MAREVTRDGTGQAAGRQSAPPPPGRLAPAASGGQERWYLLGCLIVLAGGFVLSLGAFAIRHATESDAWQYLFWRALGFTAALVTVAALRDHRNPFTQVAHLGRFGLAAAVAMAISQITFVSAVKVASFAETFLLCSLSPLIAAALARPLLGERLGWIVAVAIALAIGGVVVMTGGELEGGNWQGRILSVVSAIAFAGYTLATRGSKADERDASLIAVGCLAGLASGVAVTAQGMPILPSLSDAAIALAHGAVILSTGLFLFDQGSRHISGMTFTMLAQAEAVITPVWGYLFFKETPTLGTLLGGAMIFAAVVLQAIGGARPAATGAA